MVIAASACSEVVSAVSSQPRMELPQDSSRTPLSTVYVVASTTSPTLTLPLAFPPGRIVFTRGRSSGPASRSKPSWMFDCEQSSSTLYVSASSGYFLSMSSSWYSVNARVTVDTRRVVLVPERRSARVALARVHETWVALAVYMNASGCARKT